MILKIKSCGTRNEWFIYDGIAEANYGGSECITEGVVTYYHNDGNHSLNLVQNCHKGGQSDFQPDICIVDFTRIQNAADIGEGADVPVGWLNAVMKDGTKKTFVFSEIAYLCNDEGKTIEVIR